MPRILWDYDNAGNRILKDLETGESRILPSQESSNTHHARVVSTGGTPQFASSYNEHLKAFEIQTNKFRVTDVNNTDNTISFDPPHTQNLKMSLANAIEADPYLKNLLAYQTQYIFSDEIKPRCIAWQTDIPETREESDDLVDKIIGKKKREDYLRFCTTVDRISGVYAHAKRIYPQSYVFGQAAGWKTLSLKELNVNRKGFKLTIPEKTPVFIKPIDGYYLQKIRQDMDTFNPVFYEYHNPSVHLAEVRTEEGEKILELSLRGNSNLSSIETLLPYDRLLLFTRPNIGTTPNTWYYGVSSIMPTISNSENLRRIDEKILPELNEGQYAGVGIFTIEEDSQYDLDELANDLSKAGTRIVLDKGVTYQEIKIENNMSGILEEKQSLIKSHAMTLGIPETLLFPGETNRSIMELIINVWQSVRLEDERKIIRDTMWLHWYKDLMSIFFEGEDLIDLAIGVDLEFKNKSFTPFVDKAEQLLNMHLANAITRKELRMATDFAPYPEKEVPPEPPMQDPMMQKQAFNNSSFQQGGKTQAASNIQSVATAKRVNNQKALLSKSQQNTQKS